MTAGSPQGGPLPCYPLFELLFGLTHTHTLGSDPSEPAPCPLVITNDCLMLSAKPSYLLGASWLRLLPLVLSTSCAPVAAAPTLLLT